MSEPISPPNDAGVPQPPQANAQAHVERVLERFGGDPAAARETEPTTTPVTQAPPATPAAPTTTTPTTTAPATAEPPRRSAKEIDQRFYDRVSARKRAEQAERERDLLLNALEAAVPKRPEGAKEDPEPDFDEDPKEWYKWQTRQATKPVLDYVEDQRRREAESRKAEERQNAQRYALSERTEIMREAESEYASTVEGQGYNQRFEAYSRRIFDRYRILGYDENQAAAQTFYDLDRIATAGMQRNQNPAYFLDTLMRHELGQGVPAAAAPAPAAPPAPRGPSPELAAHRAAAASGVAGSLSVGGSAPTGSSAVGRARAASSPEKLKAALEAMPAGSGNWRQRLHRSQGR